MDAEEKRSALASIARTIATCTDCALCRGRKQAVPGEGNADADIVFIGEGPGFYEDQQGRPFVGASGKFLDELLAGIGMDRKTVFIANVVKCRPPQNRDPQPDEIAACSKHLDAQLGAIRPRVVVTLGRHSMQRYFPGESIGRLHGRPRRKDDLIVVPMYHPAAALHQGSLRKVIEADFARLPDFLSKIISSGAASVGERVPAHLRVKSGNGTPEADDTVAAQSITQTADPEPQQMRLL